MLENDDFWPPEGTKIWKFNFVKYGQKVHEKGVWEQKKPLKTIFHHFGAKKIFYEKKGIFCPKKPKKGDFQKFLWPIIWPETDKVGRFVADGVRAIPKSGQNFFYGKRTKIRDFISKKHTPPQKKALFWGGGVGKRLAS